MRPGELIAGKYRVERLLGQGGMGTVVAATNVVIDQPVALKFLLPELASQPAIVERLMREARASARLRSEHVCLVYDVGNERGTPFIVMEMLEGHDLASMVSGGVALPVPLAANYVLQAMVGLAEAHALGIVHRDLKPANLFLTRRLDGTPLVKVLDFGIAKAPSDASFHLTRTSAVMGSPGYMSPEQLRSSRDADARSDLWALGVILYELTSGRPPFVAETITELTLRVAVDPTPPLPGVPPAFERLVARCLEKDPARRFADVAQLAAALAPFGIGRAAEMAQTIAGVLRSAVSVVPVGATAGAIGAVPAVAVEGAPTTLGSSASSRLSAPRRRSWGWAAGIALVVSMAATFVVMRRSATEVAPASMLPSPSSSSSAGVGSGMVAPAVKSKVPAPGEELVAPTKIAPEMAVPAEPIAPAQAKATPPARAETSPRARAETSPPAREAKPSSAKPPPLPAMKPAISSPPSEHTVPRVASPPIRRPPATPAKPAADKDVGASRE